MDLLDLEFGLEHWPMSEENVPIHDKMVQEKRWQTNPLMAYFHGSKNLMQPTQYASALPGCTAQVSFILQCHMFDSRLTFSAPVEEIIILKEPVVMMEDFI